MAKNKHLTEADTQLHKRIPNALDDGACLTGHESKYTEKNSCSYRYQVVEHSRANGGRAALYKLGDESFGQLSRDNVLGLIQTSRYRTTKGPSRTNPSGKYPRDSKYGDQLRVPRPGDWDVDGPHRTGALGASGLPIDPGMNFTNSYWPYWNNAHHMIPQGTFNTQIENSGPRTALLIRAGLLKAKYNINRFNNMLLLPMDTEVGKLLNLPRHLTLDDGSTEFDDNPKFNHTLYNAKVTSRLDSIISDYKEEVEKITTQDEKCAIAEVGPLSKVKLYSLSIYCYESIKLLGLRNPGGPLVDLPGLTLSSPTSL
ncbi:AHH domain-containing protein [Corallococcus terminator]